jgi:hypothetical protein
VSTFVFLGPTLPVDRARQVLDATYLPPAAQGDVLALLCHRPRFIGIVDGVFDREPSVWHKEILLALESGCHVLGASSMGALRAAELHTFGMRGVGRIFEAFRDGVLEDDDEVAVAHAMAEFGHREMSDAMVNLRDALERAEQAGIVTADERDLLVRSAKATHYRERSFAALLGLARSLGWSPDRVAALEATWTGAPTLKQRDALALLGTLRELSAASPPPFRSTFRVENTVFIEALRSEVATRGGNAKG